MFGGLYLGCLGVCIWGERLHPNLNLTGWGLIIGVRGCVPIGSPLRLPFGLRVSSSGFCVSCFVFRVLIFGSLLSGFRFRV